MTKMASSESQIAVVGLGYVGLPLSFQFARSGVSVLGLDIDTGKVESLNQGKSYIKHIPSESVTEMLKSGKFSASTDFSRIRMRVPLSFASLHR
jgi:UDP-N-acetyl-D-glucosamine dehydrogenase